jgi:hypothetical protein
MIAAPTRYLAGEGAPTSSSMRLCRSLDLDLGRWKPGEEEGASEADGNQTTNSRAVRPCRRAWSGVVGVWPVYSTFVGDYRPDIVFFSDFSLNE